MSNIKLLKLNQGATFTDPLTGITIKQGQPPENPSDPILIIKEFVVVLDSSYNLGFRIYFDVFNSLNLMIGSYQKLYSSNIFIDSATASQIGVVQTDGNPLDLMEATHQLLYNVLLSQPEFASWQMSSGVIPDPIN